MLQRRLSQPFDCKVRPDFYESPEITDFSSWVDRRFGLYEHGLDPIQIDPLPPYSRTSVAWPSLPNRSSISRRSVRCQRRSVDITSTFQSRLFKSWQYHANAVRAFWGTYISFDVPIKESRDHLCAWLTFLPDLCDADKPFDEALEKTFFSYLRTSASLAMMGITVAQFLVLQHSPKPSHTFGFHVIGKPIACGCVIAAIVVTLQGSCRFWVQQDAVLRGKIWSGGWDLLLIGFSLLMVRPASKPLLHLWT